MQGFGRIQEGRRRIRSQGHCYDAQTFGQSDGSDKHPLPATDRQQAQHLGTFDKQQFLTEKVCQGDDDEGRDEKTLRLGIQGYLQDSMVRRRCHRTRA